MYYAKVRNISGHSFNRVIVFTLESCTSSFKCYEGSLATYSGAGYVETLGLEKETTKQILRELREGIWIRRGTRYVVLDFTLYNVNTNLFCVVK